MRRELRILSVIGARPEIIQAATVSAAFKGLAEEILVHTGQHYDDAMSAAQILETALPHPRTTSASARARTPSSWPWRGAARRRDRAGASPTRSSSAATRTRTLSGARAAIAAGLPLMHVEAGLRSYREDMPEERQPRRDRPPRRRPLRADASARRETSRPKASAGAVHVTGDPLCDMLESLARPHASRERRLPARDRPPQLQHRRSAERLRSVLACLGSLPVAGRLPGAPAHPGQHRVGRSRSPPTSSSSSRSPTRACWRSSAARRRSRPTPAACSARPTCGASAA